MLFIQAVIHALFMVICDESRISRTAFIMTPFEACINHTVLASPWPSVRNQGGCTPPEVGGDPRKKTNLRNICFASLEPRHRLNGRLSKHIIDHGNLYGSQTANSRWSGSIKSIRMSWVYNGRVKDETCICRLVCCMNNLNMETPLRNNVQCFIFTFPRKMEYLCAIYL